MMKLPKSYLPKPNLKYRRPNSSLSSLAPTVVEELGEGLDRIHIESLPALARDESHDVLPPPRASLASPPSASTALLTSLVLSSDFTLDPGLLDPHLLLDVDGLPLGSLDASSRRQSPRCEDDGDDLSSCALDAITAAPPTPEAAVDPPVMPFDDIFPDFDDEEEDTTRVLRRLLPKFREKLKRMSVCLPKSL
ncbi:hypothetical protein PI126_g21075 [Phytophthora idaei]|nr:hypothetical protein PI126_g21075 [Phytophthora idaei]